MTQQYILPIADVKPGDTLIPDAGFTCVPAGAARIVHQDSWFRRTLPAKVLAWFGQKPSGNWPGGSLYVNCAHGRHYLDGQLNDEGDQIVGFIKAETPVTEEERFGNSAFDLVGHEAELTEDVGNLKAGDQLTIMDVEGDSFRLMDDDGNVMTVEKSKLKIEDWLT